MSNSDPKQAPSGALMSGSLLRQIGPIWLLAVVLSAVLWLQYLDETKEQHAKTVAAAESELVNLARLSQEHAERTLFSVDQTLQWLRHQYLEKGNKLNLQDLAAQGILDDRVVLQIAVIDSQGFLKLSSLPFKAPLDLSDREHFKVHLASDRDTLFISKSVLGRASGKWSIQLTRRITSATGQFAGVVVASIDAGYFSRFYSELKLGKQGVATLFGLDGALRVRHTPDKDEFTGDVSSSPFLRILAQGQTSSTLTLKAIRDGIERTYHVRKLPSFPLMVGIGLSTADLFLDDQAADEERKIKTIAIIVLLLALAALASWLLLLKMRQERLHAHDLEHLKNLASRVPGCVFQYLLRPDGSSCLPYASDALRDIFRLDPSAVKTSADAIFALIHPDNSAEFSSSIQTSAQTLTAWTHEFRICLKDQTVRWLSGSAMPQAQADGAVLWHGFVGDITDQKTAELARQAAQTQAAATLAASRQLLQSIIDTAPMRVFWKDLNLRYLGCNPAFAQDAGLSHPDDLIGKSDAELSWRDQADLYGADDHRVMDSGIPRLMYDEPQTTPDGHTIWLRTSKVPLRNEHNDIIGILGIYEDITQQKVAEAALQRNNTVMQSILDNIPLGLSAFDSDLRLLAYNRLFQQAMDFPEAMCANPNATFEQFIRFNAERGEYGPGDHEERVQHIIELARHPVPHHLERVRPNGVALEVRGSPMPGGGFVTTYSDISERKAHQLALEKATTDAQAANLAKSRFLATMSHEIRTPMNGILGMAQLLLMPGLSAAKQHDYARTILSSGQTLLTLLNDILDLSKVEAGKFQLEAIVFAPESLLAETGNLFAGAAQAKQLVLKGQWLGVAAQRYQADAHRVRQMLSNLVGNAIKFTRSGQVHIEATEIECQDGLALLEFSVSDSGIGIAADKLDLLFKPFSQTDNSTTREFGGSGLGLSIVRNLARAMGGDVGVESTPGKGSRFWFRVQALRLTGVANSRQAERADAPPSGAAKPLLQGHVLVAEDNAVNRLVIESLLGRLGLTVSMAEDGQQALVAITQGLPGLPGQAPDVILMDLHMPVMDGYAATGHIRQWQAAQQRAHLPIIALTADAFEEDRQRCLAAGMDDFLTKPISLEALKAALARWLPAAPKSPEIALAAVLKPVDTAAFAALVLELTPLLAQNKYAAIAHFKQLEALVANTPLADEVQALATLLQNMRFDEVLLGLRHIVAGQVDGAKP